MTSAPLSAQTAKENPHARWQQALALWEMTSNDVEALPDDYENDECDFLVEISTEALSNLFATPAPDLTAFARKFRIAHETTAWEHSDLAGKLFDHLFADLDRLSSKGS